MSVLKYGLIVDYVNTHIPLNEKLSRYPSKFSKRIQLGFYSKTESRALKILEKVRSINLKLGGVRADRVARGEILKAQAIEILEYIVNNHAAVKRFANGLYTLRWNELNPAKLAIQQANRRCLAEAMTPEEEENYANLVVIRDNATALFGYSWDIDHVIPVAKGGTNAIDNLEVVPSTWNRAKRDRNSDSFWG